MLLSAWGLEDFGSRWWARLLLALKYVVITQTPEGESEGKEVGRVTAGAYFGEVALLTNQTRLATCTAVSEVACVTLERKVFTRVMGNLRELLRRDMALYNSYISVNL